MFLTKGQTKTILDDFEESREQPTRLVVSRTLTSPTPWSIHEVFDVVENQDKKMLLFEN